MMKSEFIKLTGFSFDFINSERYSCIEKAYMNTNETEAEFTKRFYREYLNHVAIPVGMLVSAEALEKKEDDYNENTILFSDIDNIYNALMDAFCRTFK